MTTNGIEHLREKRGAERLTFADICDHLADYDVENKDHDHVVLDTKSTAGMPA